MSNRPSSISRLPDGIRDKINALRDQGRTIDEIMSVLNSLDVDVSRSAVGRYVKKQAAVAEEIRRSRALAEAVARTFGDAETSKVARTNIELLHSLIMKMMVGGDEEGAAPVVLDAQDAMFIATALDRTTKAQRIDFDTQLKAAIEKERRATIEKAATTAATAAQKQGLTAETVEAIKSQILGM